MRSFRVATLFCFVAAVLPAASIVNGGFEAGLTGWTVVDQTDPLDPPGTNTFFLHSGGVSPVTGMPVASPPGGTNAAMTDSGGPGSHVLYQDFVVSMPVAPSFLSFSLYLNNMAEDFFIPSPANTLAFATPARNQQARVDILRASSDPFTVDPSDVLLTLFQTMPGDPLVTGYQNYSFDITSLLQAQAGNTLRLRFAQANNVDIFNFGVDDVSISAIPEPSTAALAVAGLLAAVIHRRRRQHS